MEIAGAIASVGVRLSDDFDALPLFEQAPYNGQPERIGTLEKGVCVRAVEKVGDFLRLERDGDSGGGHNGTLGWCDASCVVPVQFPAIYQFSTDLSDNAEVGLTIRVAPEDNAEVASKVVGKSSLIVANGMHGDWISVVHRDMGDSSGAKIRGWMRTCTDQLTLLTIRPAFLFVPGDRLPDRAQLRVRSMPDGTASQVTQVMVVSGMVFEVVEQYMNWIRVLMGDEPSAWMSTKAEETLELLTPARTEILIMNPVLPAQHGNGVKLAIRATCSTDAEQIGEVWKHDRVCCIGRSGPWIRVLYQGFKEAWMMSETPSLKYLVPAHAAEQNTMFNGGQTASVSGGHPPPPETSRSPAAAMRDEHRYMVCEQKVTMRMDPEFFAEDVGVAPPGSVIRVYEEREEVNEVKCTKDIWVRGQMLNPKPGAATGFLEGWLLAFATKRGSMMTDPPDSLAAQLAFNQKAQDIQAAQAAPAPPPAPPEPPATPMPSETPPRAAETSATVGCYMQAAGILKRREEPDSLSVELGTVGAGEIVKVEETSNLWVRVLYRGGNEGWLLTANKRGPILLPLENSPAVAAQFESQEAAAAASAVAAATVVGGESEGSGSPDSGGRCPSDGAAVGGGGAASAPQTLPSVPAAETSGPSSLSVGQYMTSGRPLKIREEADPFSFEVGTIGPGDIIRVVEVSKLWVRIQYRGNQDGWVLSANRRGAMLLPMEGNSADFAQRFEAQEASYAAAQAVEEHPPNDDDRPLKGVKQDEGGGGSMEAPINAGRGADGMAAIPDAVPPGQAQPPAVNAGGNSGDTGTTAEYMTAIGCFHRAQTLAKLVDHGMPVQEVESVIPELLIAVLAFGCHRYANLRPLKIRDEADPFSMELGVTSKGDILRVLETSGMWVRVSYRGREDGWAVTSNKRGPTLVPHENSSAAAQEFCAQEEAFAAQDLQSLPGDCADDRPLTGGKPRTEDVGEERPLTAGGKGSWTPPSEFPPGHEEAVAMKGSNEIGGGAGESEARESAEGGIQAEFMVALGLLKIREESDPFSMDLGVLQRGHVVKVLETSNLWVRVAYCGREDGWILTANKRGATLVPHEDPAAAAEEYRLQEEAFAAEASGPASSELPEERPLKGTKAAWDPPSEYPPGQEEAGSGLGGDVGVGQEQGVIGAPAGEETSASGANVRGGSVAGPEYMTALGPLKVREEPDPFSMDLGVLDRGHVVKVLEISDLWVRVAYRGREDGWVLTANKRGATFVPHENPDSAAEEHRLQEEGFAAEASQPASSELSDERPLKGARSGGSGNMTDQMSADVEEETRDPLNEYPVGQKDKAPGVEAGVGRGREQRDVGMPTGEEAPTSGAGEGSSGDSPEYMTALGLLKLREETDPFSMDLGVLEPGHVVKVLETSDLWVRVAYRGREDGWILTANKRGVTLVPHEDPAAAAEEYRLQEEDLAAEASESVSSGLRDERPLKGAKSGGAGDPEDRPLKVGAKAAWDPPSEYPAEQGEVGVGVGGDVGGGQEQGFIGTAAGEEGLASGADVGGGSVVGPEYMTALGLLKLREEADPFSMDLGVLEPGRVVKVLETSDLWVRVAYRGREDGWIVTANRRGPTLVAHENPDVAAEEYRLQEEALAAEASESVSSGLRDERPLKGAKSGEAGSGGPDAQAVELVTTQRGGETRRLCGPSDVMPLGNIPSAPECSSAEWERSGLDPDDRPIGGGRNRQAAGMLASSPHSDEYATAGGGILGDVPGDASASSSVPETEQSLEDFTLARKPTRPRLGRRAARKPATASKLPDAGDTESDQASGEATAAPEKPWLRRRAGRKPVPESAISTEQDGSAEEAGEQIATPKPWKTRSKAVRSPGKASPKPWQSNSGDGMGETNGTRGSISPKSGPRGEAAGVENQRGSVARLESVFSERDWKARVDIFEDATRACRNRSGASAALSVVGPLLPKMLLDKNVQAVDAAVETLSAYLAARTEMGATEGAILASCLAERALCCARAPVEANACSTAVQLLSGAPGALASRGAWLMFAGRAGGLENEFFPPQSAGGDGSASKKAAMAAAAPKAVAGCVKAMVVALKAGAGQTSLTSLAGGGDAREQVYTAAKSILSSAKLPIKLAGVTLATALYISEGEEAKSALGMDDMDPRIKAQVEKAFADASAESASKAYAPSSIEAPTITREDMLEQLPSKAASSISPTVRNEGNFGDASGSETDFPDEVQDDGVEPPVTCGESELPPAPGSGAGASERSRAESGDALQDEIRDVVQAWNERAGGDRRVSTAAALDGGRSLMESRNALQPKARGEDGSDHGSRLAKLRLRLAEESNDTDPMRRFSTGRRASTSPMARPSLLAAFDTPKTGPTADNSYWSAKRETGAWGKSPARLREFSWVTCRTAMEFENETRVLDNEMLVLPDGQRNIWDDMLDEVIGNVPPRRSRPPRRSFVLPPSPLPPGGYVGDSPPAMATYNLREQDGLRSRLSSLPPPTPKQTMSAYPPPPPLQAAEYENGDEVLQRMDEPEEPFETMSRTGSGTEALRRLSGGDGSDGGGESDMSIPVSAALASHRRLRRGSGNWAGFPGTGSGASGGGAGSSLTSPASTIMSRQEELAASLQAVQVAAAGAAAINGPPTEENRQLRRQSMTRRLSRGVNRVRSKRLLSPPGHGTSVHSLPESEVTMGGSPAGPIADASEAAAEAEILEAADVSTRTSHTPRSSLGSRGGFGASGADESEGGLGEDRSSVGTQQRSRLSVGSNEAAPEDESAYDSDAAYESLRNVMQKNGLLKYFKGFREKEIRLEDVRLLSEDDLAQMGMPLGARKRLVLGVHTLPSPVMGGYDVPPSPMASPAIASADRAEHASSRMFSPARNNSLASVARTKPLISLREPGGLTAASPSTRVPTQLDVEQDVGPDAEAQAEREAAPARTLGARHTSASSLLAHVRGAAAGPSPTRTRRVTRSASTAGGMDAVASSDSDRNKPATAGRTEIMENRRRVQRSRMAVAAESAATAAAAVETANMILRNMERKTSGIPRQGPSGGSRLAAPSSRLRRPVSTPSLAGTRNDGALAAASGRLEEGGGQTARQSFIPRPSPKSGRSFLRTGSTRAMKSDT